VESKLQMENDNLEVLSQAEFWSHSFFMAGNKKQKLRKQKFKAAKKEAAVIILDDWKRNIAYIGKG